MKPLASARAAWRGAKQAVPDRAGLDDANKLRYLRSYLLLRVVIGSIGLALPPVVWLGSALLPGGTWALQGSLSAYYYSGMREFFTGGLWAIGVFLLAYKVFEPTVENVLTTASGTAAVLIAFFPTTIPSGSASSPTPLQTGIGETAVGAVHYTSATVFIASLAVLSHLFGTWEGNRTPEPGRHSPLFWKRLHNACALVIALGGAFIALNLIPGVTFGSWVDRHDLWLGEVVSVLAFGTSWLCKGAELEHLGRARGVTVAA